MRAGDRARATGNSSAGGGYRPVLHVQYEPLRDVERTDGVEQEASSDGG